MLLVVALVGGGAAAWWWSQDRGPDHPSAWDPRVDDLVAFVERERELEFDHPVHIDLLPVDEFRATLLEDESALSDEDRAELEQGVAILRALGLIAGEVDLFDAVQQATGEGTLAYYTFEERRIVVRGTELDVATRATLVHELTHALQDQHFDLGDRFEAAESDETLGLQGLVEGDAVRVEGRWAEQLDDEDAAELARLEAAAVDGADFEGIPSIVLALFSAPYALGPALIQVLLADGGTAALDDAFRRLPPDEYDLLHPPAYLDGRNPRSVADPDLADGEESLDDPEPFGAIGWYLVLASRLDALETLRTVDGWAGDRSVSFERDGTVCMRTAVATRDAESRDVWRAALADWVAAGPAGTARVDDRGEELLLEACDPGTQGTAPETGDSETALLLPVARSSLFAGLLPQVPAEPAWCVADGLLDHFTVDDLTDADANRAEVLQTVLELAPRCR